MLRNGQLSLRLRRRSSRALGRSRAPKRILAGRRRSRISRGKPAVGVSDRIGRIVKAIDAPEVIPPTLRCRSPIVLATVPKRAAVLALGAFIPARRNALAPEVKALLLVLAGGSAAPAEFEFVGRRPEVVAVRSHRLF